MSTQEDGDWVRQGTPRDADAEWNDEQSEYGTTVSPVEWDDYSSEQSVPVERPRPQAAADPTDGPAVDDAPVLPQDTGAQAPAAQPTADDLSETPGDEALFGAPSERHSHLPVADEGPTGEQVGVTDVPEPRQDAAVDGEPDGDPSIEEETLDEPSLEDYDEPAIDETTAYEAAADDPRPVDTVEDQDQDATREVPVVDAGSPGHTAAAVGGAGAAAYAAGAASLPDGLYRAGSATQETAIIDDKARLEARAREADEAEARERELQAQLDAERRARDERLGVVATSSDNELRATDTGYKVSTDRFLGSFALFVLRLVTAAILGVIGYQMLMDVAGASDLVSKQPLIPEPRLVVWIVGFTLGALALLLVIGMIQRVVGFVLLALAVASLVLLRWGPFSVFQEGMVGFLGDRELLLAAVGLVLLGLGGGLWGVDGAFRRGRAKSRADKQG